MDPLTLALLLGIPIILSSKKKNYQKIKEINTTLPEGRGLFVSDPLKLIEIGYPTLSDLLKQLKVKWISVLYYKDEKDLLNLKLKGILGALAADGVKIWLWSIPSAYDIDNFIKISQKYEQFRFVSGFILNLQQSFINVTHAVSVLISSLHKGLIKPVGLFVDHQTILPEYIKFDFAFDARQIIDLSKEPVVDALPVFTISSVYSKLLEVNLKNSSYAFWNLEDIYGNEEFINLLKKVG